MTKTKQKAPNSDKAPTTTATPAQPTNKNASKNTKTTTSNVTQNVNSNVNKVNTNSNTPPALKDVTTANVERARQIRKTDCDRFQKFHNFFVANDGDTARAINSYAGIKREKVDQWMRSAVNPNTLANIQEIQETQPALLALLIVSTAINKYGEQELIRKEGLGQMDYVVGARFDGGALRSKLNVTHTVGVSFVLRLVLGLAPDKRAECQLLREILGLEVNARLVLTPSGKGLQTASDSAAVDADEWAKFPQHQIRQMARQTQSSKFQEAMQQLNGEHLYDSIRTQLKQAGGASVWETKKDKTALQPKSIRPRPWSSIKSVNPQDKQVAKKNGTPHVQSVKKNVPVEIEKFALVPPPAPVKGKSSPTKKETAPKEKTQQTKNDTAPKGKTQQTKNEAEKSKTQQVKKEIPEKNVIPVKNAKNATPTKNTTQTKNATPVKNASATIGQSQPGSIVGGARSGRATVGKK